MPDVELWKGEAFKEDHSSEAATSNSPWGNMQRWMNEKSNEGYTKFIIEIQT